MENKSRTAKVVIRAMERERERLLKEIENEANDTQRNRMIGESRGIRLAIAMIRGGFGIPEDEND